MKGRDVLDVRDPHKDCGSPQAPLLAQRRRRKRWTTFVKNLFHADQPLPYLNLRHESDSNCKFHALTIVVSQKQTTRASLYRRLHEDRAYFPARRAIRRAVPSLSDSRICNRSLSISFTAAKQPEFPPVDGARRPR